MRTIRAASFLAAVATASLLATGCAGLGGVLGDDGDNRNDPYETRIDEVRGTVERVDTRDRYIVVDRENASNDLSNRDDSEDEVIVYYDDSTRVDYRNESFRPQDLEPGDRIAAEVDRVSGRLVAQDIDVLYDTTADSGTGGVLGDDRDDDLTTADLRGTVRYIDTGDRMLEIEPTRSGNSFNTSTGSDVVTVYYDASTVVQYQGRRYGPENIERGDVVEVELRTSGGRRIAEEIEVVGQGGSLSRLSRR